MHDILFSSSPIDFVLSALCLILSFALPTLIIRVTHLNPLPKPLRQLVLVAVLWNFTSCVGNLLYSAPGYSMGKFICFGIGALGWIQLGNALHRICELSLKMKRHPIWRLSNIFGAIVVISLTIHYCVVPEHMISAYYAYAGAYLLFVVPNILATCYKMFRVYILSSDNNLSQITFYMAVSLLAVLVLCLLIDFAIPIAYNFNINGNIPKFLQWSQFSTVFLSFLALQYFTSISFKNRSSYRLISELTRHMGDSIIHYDSNGQVIFSNPAAQQLFLLSEEDFLKKNVRDLLPDIELNKERHYSSQKIQINNELHTFNINTFYVQQSLTTRMNILMLLDQTNKLFFQQRISTLNRQFSEYKQDLIRYQDRLDASEKKSRETENLNATLINALPFQFWSKNENGVYVMQNHKDITMRTNLSKTTDSPDSISRYESIARREGIATLHTSYEDENHQQISEDMANMEFKNGKPVFVYQNHFIPVVENRPPYKIIGLKIDISEESRLERERNMLREQRNIHSRLEELGTICGAFAHDYNNILGAQIGFCALAREMLGVVGQSLEDEKGKKFLSKADNFVGEAHKAALRGKESLNVLLDTVRGKTDSQIADTVFAPVEIVRDVTSKLTVTLPPNIKIDSEDMDDSLKIKAQAPSLDRILSNLSNNAIYAMKESGGTLTFRVQQETLLQQLISPYAPPVPAGDYAKISVSDTGTGMDSGTLERIFAPFFTTKAPGEGLGLGLSSAVRLLKEGHAYFTVQTTVGEGTTFNLYWNLYKETESDTKEQ